MPNYALTPSELSDVVYTVLGEAAGEGNTGMAAVTHVILNRAEDPRFPNNPALVAIEQNSSGVHQFSTWNVKALQGNNPTVRYPVTSPTYKRAELVVKQVLAGSIPDATGGAVHYWAPNGLGGMDPYWADDEATEFGRVQIGGHIFLARRAPVTTLPKDLTGLRPPIDRARTLLPAIAPPRPRIMPDVPTKRPDHTAALNVTLRRVIPQSPIDKAVARKPYEAPPPARLTTRPVSTVRIDPLTGMPTTKSALQIATENKAREMAAQGYVPKSSQPVAKPSNVQTQRQEQDAQRRHVTLQAAVTKEATRIATQMAANKEAARLAQKRAGPVKSTDQLITEAKAEQRATRQATPVAPAAQPKPRVTVSTPSTVPQSQIDRNTTPKPAAVMKYGPNSIAEQRAEQQATRQPTPAQAKVATFKAATTVPGLAVVKAQPVTKPVPAATIPGPNNPVKKGEERLSPDVKPSPLMDDIGGPVKFGDLDVLRAKVAPIPLTVTAVTAKPPAAANLAALRAKQQAAEKARVAAVAAQQRAQTTIQSAAPLRVTVAGAGVAQTKVQQLQAQGMTAAQAYTKLNSGAGSINNSDAADRVNGSSTRGSGGARSLMD